MLRIVAARGVDPCQTAQRRGAAAPTSPDGPRIDATGRPPTVPNTGMSVRMGRASGGPWPLPRARVLRFALRPGDYALTALAFAARSLRSSSVSASNATLTGAGGRAEVGCQPALPAVARCAAAAAIPAG